MHKLTYQLPVRFAQSNSVTTSTPARIPRLCGAQCQVTKGQFRRAFDLAGLSVPAKGAHASDLLTQKEVEMLSRRYEVAGQGPGGGKGEDMFVNYWKMCEQIEKVNTVVGPQYSFQYAKNEPEARVHITTTYAKKTTFPPSSLPPSPNVFRLTRSLRCIYFTQSPVISISHDCMDSKRSFRLEPVFSRAKKLVSIERLKD